MNPDDVAILVKYRLEQARTALEDAKYLLDGNRSTQSIINRSYYAGVISLFDTEFVLQ